MKKICTTLVALLAVIQFSYAQWSSGPGTVYPTTITDKIGIGTTSPASPLDIAGTPAGSATALNINYVSTNLANQTYYGQKINVTNSGNGSAYGLDINVTRMGSSQIFVARGINGVVNVGATSAGGTPLQHYGSKFIVNGSTATSSTLANLTMYGTYGEVANNTAVGESSNSYGLYGKASSISTVYGVYGAALAATGASGTNTYGIYGTSTGISGTNNTYGMYATATGVSGNNIYGGYFNATGGTNNYGVYSAGGINYFNGKVGIGINAPASALDVTSILTADSATSVNVVASGVNVNQDYYGQKIKVTHTGATTGGGAYGIDLSVTKIGTGVRGAGGIKGVVNVGARAAGGTIISFWGSKFVVNGSTATSSTERNTKYYGTYGEVNNTTAVGQESSNYGIYGKAAGASGMTVYGGYFSGTGGTTNYGVYSAAGVNYFNGAVGIGTTTPREALSVNGTIRSKAIKIELSNWPDYVFRKGYQLPSLASVKNYIDQNHHLPEMPSEAEVTKDGINLGEIAKIQTKKIEELTLYLIEKDVKDKEKDARLKSQQEQINELKRQIDRLVKK